MYFECLRGNLVSLVTQIQRYKGRSSEWLPFITIVPELEEAMTGSDNKRCPHKRWLGTASAKRPLPHPVALSEGSPTAPALLHPAEGKRTGQRLCAAVPSGLCPGPVLAAALSQQLGAGVEMRGGVHCALPRQLPSRLLLAQEQERRAAGGRGRVRCPCRLCRAVL